MGMPYASGNNAYVWPGFTTHPTVRAAAALPAAGAWDAAPTEVRTSGFGKMTLYVRYTRGAGNGAVGFYVEASPYLADSGTDDWYQQSLYESGAVSGAEGTDIKSLDQREYVSYEATSDDDELFVFTIDLLGGAQRVRVPCREDGVPATPGTCHIEAVLAV